jgi:Arm DNA-binding domain
MERNLKILTWLYKSKVNSKGEAPILIRLSIGGKKTEISTGKFIEISSWDTTNSIVKGKDKLAKQVNEDITSISPKFLKYTLN